LVVGVDVGHPMRQGRVEGVGGGDRFGCESRFFPKPIGDPHPLPCNARGTGKVGAASRMPSA